ncbi:MAG: hypothetical protein KJ606_01550 [Chloroflexi bacterium]|nr:hypothetical protein [Chloroflexota bacterium]
MYQKGFASKIGGLLSLVSLLALPLFLKGCSNSSLSGFDILMDEDIIGYKISLGAKVFLIIAIVCAIGSLLVKSKWEYLGVGFSGLVFWLNAYETIRSSTKNFVELAIGGYIAFIGFILVIGEGLVSARQKADHEEDTS